MNRNNAIRLNLTFILVAAALMVLISASSSFGASAPKATGMTNSADGVVLRKSSSEKSKSLGLLSDDTELIIHKEVFKKKSSRAAKNIWYYVTANGIKGYVRSDFVDNVKYTVVVGKTTSSVNYRKGAGTGMKNAGKYKKKTRVEVVLKAKPHDSYKGSSSTWYKVRDGSNFYYVCANKVKLTNKTYSADSVDQDFETYMTQQGFPETYKVKLRELHQLHPNWGFVAYNTNINWSDALAKETKNGVSLIHSSYDSKYRSGSKQIEPGWYNANSATVAYFMDPRNFLTEDRILMFEDLTYKPDYQTASVVAAILAPSQLPAKGFTANIFIDAAAKTNVSPVFLAARARQEVGGGSDAINGVNVLGEVVYNPFNIGAFGGTNPLYNGLLFARAAGWTTQAKAVEGGAAELSKYYISKGQNTIYYQRFNVRNGVGNAGTHQYMTNIHAPYNEAYNTKDSYDKYGILGQPLVFEIPIYNNMPAQTNLP